MSHSCNWCASTRTIITDRDAYHKVDHTFGPFDLFACQQCGSLGTCNPPSRERLASFYRTYEESRPEWYRAGSQSGALASQYDFYARHVLKHLPATGTSWADIGAGHGEIATILHKLRPDLAGTAIDIAAHNSGLPAAVDYHSVDFNQVGWAQGVDRRFDLVYSVAVWEHVLSPLNFVAECLRLVSPGGVLVMVTPDFGAVAARLLKKNWPYYQPGEHLSVPTLVGADMCVRRAGHEIGYSDRQFEVRSRPIWVGYSVSYLLQVLRLKPLARLMPVALTAPLPTGVLSTTVKIAVASNTER